MNGTLLHDIVLIFGLAIAVLLIGFQFRVPLIVGFFLTGVLAGPHGWKLVEDASSVDLLAEIGVILLLFTIGIEFSLKHLLEARRAIMIGGLTQFLLTAGLTFLLVRITGTNSRDSIFVGVLVAMSSTVVTIKLLQDRAELESPYGRAVLSIAIFQDLLSVPLMMFIPMLAAGNGLAVAGDGESHSALILGIQSLGILALSLLAANKVVPWVLFQVARTRNRELFLMCVAAIGLGVALLTSKLGLSLALGAFLAGLIVSESDYSHQALGNILPLRDVFASFFFISIGMLIDMHFLASHALVILVLVAAAISIKTFMAAGAGMLLGLPLRGALLAGLTLSQVGEFSFILSAVGIENGLLSPDLQQYFLAVSVISMGATPILVGSSRPIINAILKLPLPQIVRTGFYRQEEAPKPTASNHLIIVGFGLIGRMLASAAESGGIAHVIIEMNAETVRAERKRGVPIFFGDASQDAVLEHAKLLEARVMVVAINDAPATRKIVETARRLHPALHIIARTRFLPEMEPLRKLGADETIPEEFETSVEIFTRVLRRYLVPASDIASFAERVRAQNYGALRARTRQPMTVDELKVGLPDHAIVTFRVEANSDADGRTLGELNLRQRHSVTVLAVRCEKQTTPNPDGSQTLRAGDTAILFGLPAQIRSAGEIFGATGLTGILGPII